MTAYSLEENTTEKASQVETNSKVMKVKIYFIYLICAILFVSSLVLMIKGVSADVDAIQNLSYHCENSQSTKEGQEQPAIRCDIQWQ